MPSHCLRDFFFFLAKPSPAILSKFHSSLLCAPQPFCVPLLSSCCVLYVEACLLPGFLSPLSSAFYTQSDCVPLSFISVLCLLSHEILHIQSHCNSNECPSSVPLPCPPALCSDLLLFPGFDGTPSPLGRCS